jgi:hypothetical protein
MISLKALRLYGVATAWTELQAEMPRQAIVLKRGWSA